MILREKARARTSPFTGFCSRAVWLLKEILGILVDVNIRRQAAAFVAAVEDDQPGFFCLSDMFDGDRCQVFSAHH